MTAVKGGGWVSWMGFWTMGGGDCGSYGDWGVMVTDMCGLVRRI